ncbi:MAG: hypothetical protein QXN55_06955 [Candidatus Nitrosotenuis sp.]
MKTRFLISIIAVLGISLVTLTFTYQHIQNCKAEGGSITGSLECDKTNYELMMDLFQKKYAPERGSIIDRTDGATLEMISTDPQHGSMTLLINEHQNGPYSVELICKYKSGKIERITKDVMNYIENGGCFGADSFEFATKTTVSSKTITPRLCQYDPQVFNVMISQSGNAQRQVFFVKTNSTAHLCIEYTSITPNEGMFSFPMQLHTNYYSANVAPTTFVNLTREPGYMPLGYNSTVTVTYNITTGNKTGTYWIQNPYNEAFPIVVYSDAPNVDPSEIPILIRNSGNPVDVVSTKIVGYDGGIMEYRDAKPLEGR